MPDEKTAATPHFMADQIARDTILVRAWRAGADLKGPPSFQGQGRNPDDVVRNAGTTLDVSERDCMRAYLVSWIAGDVE